MNVLAKIPPNVRLVAYVVFGVASLIMAYLGSHGVIDPDLVALWTSIGAFLGLTAASNVHPQPRRRREL